MSLANLEHQHRRPLYAVLKPRRQEPVQERISDSWPDFSSERSEVEISIVAQKNRPAIVLWEAVHAVAMCVGMVVGLMVLLADLGVRQ